MDIPKIGDWITVRYYISESSDFGYMNDYYYGKVIKIQDNDFITYEVHSKCVGKNNKLIIGCRGSEKWADVWMVQSINEPFGFNKILK